MTPIGISIITPVYNRADCIVKCLKSVENQDYINYEHIIVNDGSTDDLESIIHIFCKNNPKIRYISYSENKGVNFARNRGVADARMDYVFFLDSDDTLVNGALNLINETVHKSIDFCSYLFINEDRLEAVNKCKALDKQTKVLHFSDHLSGTIPLSLDFAYLFQTNILKKFPFNEDLPMYEGITYYRIYKDSSQQLFSKIIICKRDRKRNDNISSSYYLINEKRIETALIYNTSLLTDFYNDYLNYGLEKLLYRLYWKTIIMEKIIGPSKIISMRTFSDSKTYCFSIIHFFVTYLVNRQILKLLFIGHAYIKYKFISSHR